MKKLKKFWEKCGDERFTAKALAVLCTTLTAFNLFFCDNPFELDMILVLLNGAVIFGAAMEDD